MGPFFSRIGNDRGAALIVIFLVITVLLVFLTTFFNISMSQTNIVDTFKKQTRAFGLAESGLDRAVNWLRAQSSPPAGNQTNPWGGVTNFGGGNYTVTIADLGAVDETPNIRRYNITSTGSYGNMDRRLSNIVQVDNYARYIWFTNSETFGGSNVWFWSQDHLDGPVHTNSHYNIYGNPEFGGGVGSVDDYIRFYNNSHNVNLHATTNSPYDQPDFQQGVEFGVEPISMPTQALNLRAAASSGGMSLTGSTTIILNNNGTMQVTNSKSGYSNTTMGLPANGALFVNKGNLTISGSLNGRLSVGASKNILIPNNLTYANDPLINSSSNDALGIISETDVIIKDNGPANITIDGCIMALNTAFMLQNYDSVAAKGNVTILGSVIQKERGPVGTFNGATGQKISGYGKNYTYDSRLLTNPPPFVPTTGDYISLSWEEN